MTCTASERTLLRQWGRWRSRPVRNSLREGEDLCEDPQRPSKTSSSPSASQDCPPCCEETKQLSLDLPQLTCPPPHHCEKKNRGGYSPPPQSLPTSPFTASAVVLCSSTCPWSPYPSTTVELCNSTGPWSTSPLTAAELCGSCSPAYYHSPSPCYLWAGIHMGDAAHAVHLASVQLRYTCSEHVPIWVAEQHRNILLVIEYYKCIDSCRCLYLFHYTGSFWLYFYAFISYKLLKYSGSPLLSLWAEEQKPWIHEIYQRHWYNCINRKWFAYSLSQNWRSEWTNRNLPDVIPTGQQSCIWSGPPVYHIKYHLLEQPWLWNKSKWQRDSLSPVHS